MPHQPKDEHLAVVILSDIAKIDRRAVELEFAKELPLWRQRLPGRFFLPGAPTPACAGSRLLLREQFHFNKGGNKMAGTNKPTNMLRGGNIKATIWQNDSEKGPFFTATFSRPFKDQSGAWRNAMGLRSVLMIPKPSSMSRVRPRSGLPLTS